VSLPDISVQTTGHAEAMAEGMVKGRCTHPPLAKSARSGAPLFCVSLAERAGPPRQESVSTIPTNLVSPVGVAIRNFPAKQQQESDD